MADEVQSAAPEPTVAELLKNKKPKDRVSVGWFNIRSGEVVYTDKPPQIKGYIESSDMGVNKQSDKGWRLDPEWVNKLRKARRDRALMATLSKMSGGEVTDMNVLVAVFESESMAFAEVGAESEDTPFEQEYLDKIRQK